MKQMTKILCVLVLTLSVGSMLAQDKMKSKAKESVVKGEVVDVSCYLAHGKDGIGDGHKECAAACAKNGGMLGILTKEGMLYVSVLPDDHKTGPNAILMDHVSHNVEATGIVRKKGGVNGIMITKVEMADGEKKEIKVQ